MFTHLKEGWIIAKKELGKRNYKKYKGDSKQICEQIVKNCYNGKFLQTSAGHFSSFWIRDFGICAEALVKIGYKKQAQKTLKYALEVYEKNNKISTTISHNHKPFNVFTFSPDSLPFLIRSLIITNSKSLIKKHKKFLEKQTKLYFKTVIDKDTGLVKKRFFSSMKDNSRRKSSCYDNCMVGMLSNDLNTLKLKNPFKKYDYEKLIIENFWTGDYFKDDLETDYVAGDANVFPFWCGLINNKEMFKKTLKSIKQHKLDKPFPLKYTSTNRHRFNSILSYLINNYQGSTIWMNIGLCFLDVVKKYDKKQADIYIKQYDKIIKKQKNFLELYFSDGKPYNVFLYKSDESIIWASKYVNLIKNRNN